MKLLFSATDLQSKWMWGSSPREWSKENFYMEFALGFRQDKRKKKCMEKPNLGTEVVKHSIVFRTWEGATLNSPEYRELHHYAFISI